MNCQMFTVEYFLQRAMTHRILIEQKQISGSTVYLAAYLASSAVYLAALLFFYILNALSVFSDAILQEYAQSHLKCR